MTTHLIKIQTFTHASRVTNFSLYEFCTYRELFEIPEPLGFVRSFLLAVVLQSHLDC